MEKTDKIRVLLVDDQQLFAESLRTFLSNYADDIEVLGIACNGREAVDRAMSDSPDIILMDIHMPVMNGVEAVAAIKAARPAIKILVLSTYDEDEYVRAALSNGASGYLLKDISPTELIASVRALSSGVLQISPQIAQKLISRLYTTEEEKPAGDSFEWYKTLSKREREIFALIATGYDNDEIAEKLFLAEQTVRNHVSLIYSKLQVKDRFEIIRLANKIQI